MSPTDPVAKHFRLTPVQLSALKRLGILHIEDLIRHFPTRYEQAGSSARAAQLVPGTKVTLVGTVTNAKFNVYCFYVDGAAAKTSAMGTEAATLALVTLPVTPVGKALVGMVVINPTGTGNFVGGTTALDDGTVTPNAVYISPVGPIDHTVLL